ncbi:MULTISPECIES: CopG family transcriptional regulator [Mycolicibacter]|uniref:ribbon-helix-helix domain-containing protein n=1 Tax=Mycolicibacter TaxID=1073531 RepID=UPI00061AD1A6|nr:MULTISPECIES: CopG family transcriptional regulator [Mycobacteriaceae]OBJ30794.1 antitoxin [Mycolicibacter heraklionensis]ULP48850.1 ribbon-helix-helix domain-containing protein [Mycolicibacter virginiensis]
MRTTLSIDDDVLLAVKERAHRERRPVGEVLSELARQALTRHDNPTKGSESFHGFAPLPHRGTAVSNALIDRLRDEEGV